MLRAMTLYLGIVRDFFGGAPDSTGWMLCRDIRRSQRTGPRVTCGLPLPGKARLRLSLIAAPDNRTAALICAFGRVSATRARARRASKWLPARARCSQRRADW